MLIETVWKNEIMLGFDSVRAYCAKSILDACLGYYEKSLILLQLDWNSDNVP